MGYDLEGARKAGISDQEILSTLVEKYNYDLAGARAAGISDDQILNALSTVPAPSEPVVEKESPELMGYLGAGAGAVGAAGDVIYSKGRPLIRMGEKMLGMDTSTPTAKPRTFSDPSTVAQQAIGRRMPVDPTTGGAVKTWAETQHAGEFLGGKEYSEADKIKKAAMDFEAKNPGQKVLPGSLLAVPEAEAKNLSQQKAALAAEQDRLNQAEVQKVAQTRAERLGERADLKQKVARKNIATGAGTIATKVAAPILGGYELGSQGAQAYNRLTRPDMTASDVAAGVTNVAGAGAGALSMLPSKLRIPAAILAQGTSAIANWLDKRNPRNEEIEQKAKGGLIQHFEKGGVALAKKLVRGYLENTPKKPNPLVGTRFELEDLGGVNPVTPLDINKIKGSMLTASPADMTSANQRIVNIAGIPMTSDIVTHGGHPFARSKKNIERKHGWASNEAAAGSGQTRANIASTEGEMLGGSGEALMLPMTMGKGSENFSVPVAQSYYDIFKQAEFNPAEMQKINEEIRNYKIRGKTPLQGFLGVEHPEAMEQMLKGGYGLEGSHHDLRKAYIERLQLKDRMRAMGVNEEDIAAAHLDPNLLGVPQGYAGHTVLKSKPGAEILPSDSVTYSHALQKEYMGDIGNTPVSVLLEKPYKNIYQELEAKYPGKTATQIHAQTLGALGKRKAGVSQLVDDETINRVGTYHEAVKQGLIDPNDYKAAMEYLSVPGRYAAGGGVAKKALDLAKEAFKKKFTPGFYHGSPSNKIEAFDPSKGSIPNVKDHITPNVTFVTPKPDFAESFLPEGFNSSYRTGSTMYPVSVNLGKHFDPNTPEGSEVIRQYLLNKYKKEADTYGFDEALGQKHEHYMDKLTHPVNNWKLLENPEILDYLKSSGHNSFSVTEGGIKNVGVFEPQNIRGKFAKFNPEDAADPDFMKAAGGLVHLAGGGKIPEAVVKAYKLFKTKGGNTDELYPLFVNANKPVPLNEWVNAEVGPVAASGKVKSKLGELAYRPGWHAGDLPVATHIGGKSAPGLKAPDFRRPDEVWAEVEMPADVDWQQIANQRARLNKAGEPIASTAHITDAIPEGGFYRYKTSPNMQGNWLIGGGMKVNRVLTDEEVQAINEAAGVADLPRFTKFNE
jgi:hypothetical protein